MTVDLHFQKTLLIPVFSLLELSTTWKGKSLVLGEAHSREKTDPDTS